MIAVIIFLSIVLIVSVLYMYYQDAEIRHLRRELWLWRKGYYTNEEAVEEDDMK